MFGYWLCMLILNIFLLLIHGVQAMKTGWIWNYFALAFVPVNIGLILSLMLKSFMAM